MDADRSAPATLRKPPRPRDPPRTRYGPSTPGRPALLSAAAGDRSEALYVLAVTTGMRQGELLGLAWEDVDLERGVVRVRRTLTRDRGRLSLEKPKTKKSRRTVPLAARGLNALKAHRKAQLEERVRYPGLWEDNGIVFANQSGNLLNPSNLRKRSFAPLLARAGLPVVRFHDLRHTAATLLLAQGVHPKYVQELLGTRRSP